MLALSILALGLSVVSLGWQVIAWRRGGPVVQVSQGLMPAHVGGGDELRVVVRNLGRFATTVDWCSFLVGDTKVRPDVVVVLPETLDGAEPFPFRLEGHSSQIILFDAADLRRRAARIRGGTQPVRAFVQLGNGHHIVCKKAQWLER